MTPPIAFDLTRLFLGPIIPTPRGIDRVDLGYATHFLEQWRGDCVATLPTPLGVRAVEREAALRLCHFVASVWGERTPPGEDPALQFVKRNLAGTEKETVRVQSSPANVKRTVLGLLRSIAESGGLVGNDGIRTIPENAVYLNTGHLGLSFEWMISWLRRRTDVKPIFMLHDTIPIDHPEYVSPVAKRVHSNMLDNAARYAHGVIVTTEMVRHCIAREIRKRGREDVPIVAARLPVAQDFCRSQCPDPDLQGHRYFIVCGSIEPRKNHALLLHVWRRLTEEYGESAPKLVIVGTPWRQSAPLVYAVCRSTELRRNVMIASGLSTPALQRLIQSAAGLLMPSFIEGFGLPIVEALACGTPVIASDLPAHREAGGLEVTYLDPKSPEAWLAAVRDHLIRQADLRNTVSNHRAWTWHDYARCIEPFVDAIWREPNMPAATPATGMAAEWAG
jgi:glycosyltransferase involved in cell wall biosynthesis